MLKSLTSAIAGVVLFIAGAGATLAGRSPERTREIRFLRFVVVVVAIVLRRRTQRGAERSASVQCGARPFAFVVHGLWPQYERGFPENCQVPAPRLYRGIVDFMLDMMPAPRLIYNEWDRHGTCSGLSPRAYFDVRSPGGRENPGCLRQSASAPGPDAGFAGGGVHKANSGLSAQGMSIECDRRRLTEVRICLSRALQFRDCPEIARRSCKRDQVVMPPVRNPLN